MRILLAHSFYRTYGGEDRYVTQQAQLLSGTHEVEVYERANITLDEGIGTAARMTYSRDERDAIERAIADFRPDLIHLHNPYPGFGPVVHLAAKAHGIPLVVTAHNYRLRCPNGMMFTEGAPCHRCEGGMYANAVLHHCFPTAAQSAAYAIALWTHRFIFDLEGKVATFIAPSRFMLERLIGWGVPEERIALVRNFTDVPPGNTEPGIAGVYLGRMSSEKGLDVLVRALHMAGDPPFRFIGDGPSAGPIQALAQRFGLANVQFLGRLDRDGVIGELRTARYVTFSSQWDENAPLAALEAMAAGRPLVVTRSGGLTELVESGAGIACDVGDTAGLVAAISRATTDDEFCRTAGARGMELAAAEYSPQRHLAQLDQVYASARASIARPTTAPVHRYNAVQRPHPALHGDGHEIAKGASSSPPLRVLMAHCYYQGLGGEDLSFEAEANLLSRSGLKLVSYVRDNQEIVGLTTLGKARLAMRTIWADDSYRALDRLAARERPQIAHFQNTFPLISPAAYHACRRHGAAVVQALRNYRLVCANGLLFRDGRVCEDCLGKSVPWPGVAHKCYRGSRKQSAAVVGMLTVHRLLGTWDREVDLYIAPSEFSRDKFIEAGFAAEKLVVKPNFVHPDPGANDRPGGFAVYAGRLAFEKGVLTLLEAWRRVGDVPLKIVGDGPIAPHMRRFIARHGLSDKVEMLGHGDASQVIETMRTAKVVILPSQWYETFGRVAIEAFACAVPVIASGIGAMGELVTDGRTGLHFVPGDADDLAAKVSWAWSHEDEVAVMGRQARQDFEARFTAERNLEILLKTYHDAIERSQSSRQGGRPGASRRGTIFADRVAP